MVGPGFVLASVLLVLFAILLFGPDVPALLLPTLPSIRPPLLLVASLLRLLVSSQFNPPSDSDERIDYDT